MRIGGGAGGALLTRNWIVYNKGLCFGQAATLPVLAPDASDAEVASAAATAAKISAAQNAHAGSLLAFGLSGALNVLNNSDIGKLPVYLEYSLFMRVCFVQGIILGTNTSPLRSLCCSD